MIHAIEFMKFGDEAIIATIDPMKIRGPRSIDVQNLRDLFKWKLYYSTLKGVENEKN